MLVNDLKLGMLLEPLEDFKYYIQESRDSSLPRLRIAPSVIASWAAKVDLDVKQEPIMYLGISENKLKSTRKKLRTVMVGNEIAFLEGREFSKFSPLSSEFSWDNR